MVSFGNRFALVLCLFFAALLAAPALAQNKSPDAPPDAASKSSSIEGLDEFIQNVMAQWKVPGLAVAVTHDGKVVHLQGYGFRDVEKKLPVTPKTIFAIGSISKSFTVTGLGMLVDEGKLDWDKPVRNYLSDFQLFNNVASEQMTARDLVTHRSGLPRHDFVWYADPSLGRQELYRRLRHLEPSKPFRSTWQYQNLMYMTAGVLAERITGKSWEDFTHQRIIQPLGMKNTNFSVNDSQKEADFALPYSLVKGKVKPVPFHNIDAVGPAGSINSNVEAMIRYVQFHINRGKHNKKTLLSAQNAAAMITPQMVMPGSASPDEELGHSSYGLGLMISTYRGHIFVQHGGGIDGFISLLSFMPRKKMGVIVLTNLSGYNPVPTIVTRGVYDRLLKLDPVDWSARLQEARKKQQKAAQEAKRKNYTQQKKGTSPSHELAEYAGRYEHPAYGAVTIAHENNSLRLTTSGGLSGDLKHFHYDVFQTAEDPGGRLSERKVTFLYDKKGEIDRLTIPFEPAVSDIILTRVADESMRRREFLEPLAGKYQIGPATITVALKDDHTLTLQAPAQPTYELVPDRGMTFKLKGLSGFSVAFKKDASGKIHEAVLFQPNGTFAAKRISPSKVAVTADAESTVWTPETMMKVRRVGGVRVSPDGKQVVYTVAKAVMKDDRSQYVTQIYLAGADGSDPIQLTFNKKSSSNPQWSPDSKSIAFTSSRSGKNNLYLLRLAGGEARPLTDVKTSVGAFAWSPDGSQIALTMADPPSEQEEKSKKSKDDARWVDEDVKMNRLYVLSLEPDSEGDHKLRKLTSGEYNVGGRGGSFDWSPDGKTIVLSRQRTPKADDWPTSDVALVDVKSGEVKPLAATSAAELGPVYSPDGKSIAMIVTDDPPRWAFHSRIQIVPAAGGQPKVLPPTYDGRPSLLGWSADGGQIFFSESRGVGRQIYSIDKSSGKISIITDEPKAFGSIHLNRSATMIGLAMEGSHQPVEAYVSPIDKFSPRKISRANSHLPTAPLGKVEVIRWKSDDGKTIEGLLTYPVGHQPGRRAPLLLQIHGGPAGVFATRYIARAGVYPNAAFAARGFAVLQPNPRGSSGYGKEFRFANYKDWGGGDFRDLMAGVDHLIAEGIADPERLGVMGWSYGGYMTSWTITQTDRFKAASVGAAVTNLASFTGTSDIPGFLPDYFGGEPWEASDLYRGRSALFNAKGVKTPTLIQHPESDVRVPVSQGYEFYNALKRQGVPVRMLVLPRQAHGPSEPKMLLKVMQTNLEWFEQRLKPQAVAQTAAAK